jgi:hypothetical protein
MSRACKEILVEVAEELGSVDHKDWDKLPCGDSLHCHSRPNVFGANLFRPAGGASTTSISHGRGPHEDARSHPCARRSRPAIAAPNRQRSAGLPTARPEACVSQTPPSMCDAGRGGNGLTTAEREELAQLRRENRRQLRLERDILSKAAAWFARETNAIPSKGSGS